MRMPGMIVALIASTLMLAACTNEQVPAEQAVAKIDGSLGEIRADAEKYATDQLKTVDASVAHLKENLAKKDYQAVVVGAPSVASDVSALREAVTEMKANAEATLAAAQSEWTTLSAEVPPMVEKLQARIDSLAKTRKYPEGMDKAAFETAKASFETAKTEWTEAAAEFTSGEAANAVRKARTVKARGEELMQQLGLNC